MVKTPESQRIWIRALYGRYCKRLKLNENVFLTSRQKQPHNVPPTQTPSSGNLTLNCCSFRYKPALLVYLAFTCAVPTMKHDESPPRRRPITIKIPPTPALKCLLETPKSPLPLDPPLPPSIPQRNLARVASQITVTAVAQNNAEQRQPPSSVEAHHVREGNEALEKALIPISADESFTENVVHTMETWNETRGRQ